MLGGGPLEVSGQESGPGGGVLPLREETGEMISVPPPEDAARRELPPVSRKRALT